MKNFNELRKQRKYKKMYKRIYHALRRFFVYRLRDAKLWVLYRTVYRFHVVDTGLEPGYYDKDHLMLHACFNLLKNYVEVECAWMEMYKEKVPWYMSRERYAKKHGRRLGLRHLSMWEEKEKCCEGDCISEETIKKQREADQEIRDLYLWWVDIFPNTVYLGLGREQEEERMLTRLIKVRGRLWT